MEKNFEIPVFLLKSRTKNPVLKEITNILYEEGCVKDKKLFLECLKKREELGTTGAGGGVACPEASRVEPDTIVNDCLFAIGLSYEGVNFDSLDRKPVHLFFVHSVVNSPKMDKISSFLWIVGAFSKQLRNLRDKDLSMTKELESGKSFYEIFESMDLSDHSSDIQKTINRVLLNMKKFDREKNLMDTNIFLNEVPFAIVDIETTGLSSHYGDRICEIAVLRIQNGKEVGSFTSLINPKKPISSGASRVNGITDDMVKNSPTFDTIIDKILPLLKDSCIVCHNAGFDLSFISTQMKNLRLQCLKNPVVDTLFLAKKYFDFPSNALGNIARDLNISLSDEHRAMGDVVITQKIFNYFIKDLEKRKGIKTLEDLLKLQGGSIKIPEPEEIILPPLIEEAFKSKSIIKMQYVSADGVETIREVEPIEVSKRNDYMYLIAFCNLRKEQRTFRLDRIVNMTLK